jgi:hypothetical protein
VYGFFLAPGSYKVYVAGYSWKIFFTNQSGILPMVSIITNGANGIYWTNGVGGLTNDGTIVLTPANGFGSQVEVQVNTNAIVSSVTGLFDKIFGAYNAQQTIDLNKQRLAAGLPPVNSSALAPTVNFGLSSNTMLLFGAVALFLLMAKKR